jgi:Flp pilus assembly CpaF family ATPase
VFVARRGRSELTTTILAPGEPADLVERMLRTSGRRIDMSQPFVDAMMPAGSRLHVVIPVSSRSAVKSHSRAGSTQTPRSTISSICFAMTCSRNSAWRNGARSA